MARGEGREQQQAVNRASTSHQPSVNGTSTGHQRNVSGTSNPRFSRRGTKECFFGGHQRNAQSGLVDENAVSGYAGRSGLPLRPDGQMPDQDGLRCVADLQTAG